MVRILKGIFNRKKQRRGTLKFPELRTIKIGEQAIYDLKHREQVRAAVAYLRKRDGIDLLTVSDPEKNELIVWLNDKD